MYGKVVLGVDGAVFDDALDAAKATAGVSDESRLDATAWKALCKEYKALIRAAARKAVPPGPPGPAAWRHRGRVPLLERGPGHRLPGA